MECIYRALGPTLQLSKDQGGMAVPHPQMYYFAAQLQHFTGWDLETSGTPPGVFLSAWT